MRKLLLVITGLVLVVAAYCQEVAEPVKEHGHVLYDGVAVYGNVQEFCSSLEEKGYLVVSNRENTLHLSGGGSERQRLELFVPYEVPGWDILGLTVLKEAGSSWSAIRNAYMETCREYCDRLGEPTSSGMSFLIDTEDNETKILYAIRLGLCEWQSLWEKEEGITMITIKSVGKQFKIAISFVDYTRL